MTRGRKIKEGWKDQMRAGKIIYCALCGNPISIGGDKGLGNLTVDHIIPACRGGTLRLDNVQPAHSKCNGIKGNLDTIGEAVKDPWGEERRKLAYLYAAGFLLWAGLYLWYRLWMNHII